MSQSSVDADQAQEPQIDESAPGSSADENDGVTQHLDGGDTLLDRGVDASLDAAWVPPDRDPGIDVPTIAEQEAGESLDDKLAQEVPDVIEVEEALNESEIFEIGSERSGRLIDAPDSADLMIGQDVGVDGAAATAEEAAIHVIHGC